MGNTGHVIGRSRENLQTRPHTFAKGPEILLLRSLSMIIWGLSGLVGFVLKYTFFFNFCGYIFFQNANINKKTKAYINMLCKVKTFRWPSKWTPLISRISAVVSLLVVQVLCQTANQSLHLSSWILCTNNTLCVEKRPRQVFHYFF